MKKSYTSQNVGKMIVRRAHNRRKNVVQKSTIESLDRRDAIACASVLITNIVFDLLAKRHKIRVVMPQWSVLVPILYRMHTSYFPVDRLVITASIADDTAMFGKLAIYNRRCRKPPADVENEIKSVEVCANDFHFAKRKCEIFQYHLQ